MNKKIKEMAKIIQDLYLKLIFNKETFKRTQAKMMLELKNDNLTRKSKDTLWHRMDVRKTKNKQTKKSKLACKEHRGSTEEHKKVKNY